MKRIILILALIILVSGCAQQREELPQPLAPEDQMPPSVTGPGGCTSQEECIAYCSEHREECELFDQQKGIAPEKAKESEEEQILVVPSAPLTEIGLYKGFWMPAAFYIDHSSHTMTDVSKAKESGANIVSLGVPVQINSKGEVRYPKPFDDLNGIEKTLNELATKYYGAGIKIHLAIEPTYTAEFSDSPSGEPQPFPTDISSKAGFLDEYNLIVEEVSALAEKYHVEMFSPMNEPDRKLGNNLASQWDQEILPKIKKNYHGKIVFKGDLNKDSAIIDFKGYDVIGFSISPGGHGLDGYEQEVKELLDDVLSWSWRDSVPQVMITEFGCWGGASRFDDATKAEAHRIVFEQAKGKVNGFIVFDPPADQGWSLEDSPETLGEVKSQFKEKL